MESLKRGKGDLTNSKLIFSLEGENPSGYRTRGEPEDH
jgi:hypothetical protein